MTRMAAAAGAAPFPGMVALHVWGFRCERCYHAWIPRQIAKVCPRCKSAYWDRPRRATA